MCTKRRIDLVVCLLVVGTAIAIGWRYYRDWLNNRNMGIGPKWEIIMAGRPSDDSLHHRLDQIRKEREAMDDYFAVHNVTDEGFDLIAQHDNQLQQEQFRLKSLLQTDSTRRIIGRRYIPETKRPLIAVRINGGYWKAGRFHFGLLNGPAVWRDPQGRIVCGLWDNDTIVVARRYDDEGCYDGQMDTLGLASGQGSIVRQDGSSYTGMWVNDRPEGWGFESSSHGIKAGEWRKGRFLGEKIKYTSERIYGIDISRHQHEKGRKRFTINWRQVRITSLGSKHNKHVMGRPDFPISFVYIKATEGISIRNRYYAADCQQARRQGIRVGAYHFMSLKTSAERQARHFLRYAQFRRGDFPPVLDVEPSHAQIAAIGGAEQLFKLIRTWCNIVERSTGHRPILYVSQMFVNRYLSKAPDIKQRYQVWIARYGEYKPDVHLVFWQLSPEGRVAGIHGPVDINVFNGYGLQYQEFLRNNTMK